MYKLNYDDFINTLQLTTQANSYEEALAKNNIKEKQSLVYIKWAERTNQSAEDARYQNFIEDCLITLKQILL